MTDQTTPDRHTCHDQKTAAGPAWKCPRCSLPPADQTAPLADRLAHPEAVREQVRRALDFTYAVSLGYESSDQLLATYDACRTPADQTALRNRIAEAALAVVEAALGDTLVPAARAEVLAGIAAVLPAPADQAAGLREAADRLAELRAAEREWLPATGLHQGEQELRRMADETATTETQPRRGDAFEAWLKRQRDACFGHASSWAAVDGLLDRYRLHADTGTPLGEHMCEAKSVGDCECLEQPVALVEPKRLPPMDPVRILGIDADDEPAAGAQQDGASS